MSTPVIRLANLADSAALAGIYNWYIEKTTITFEEQAITQAEMQSRICLDDATRPWLVMQKGQETIGYAYAAPWKPRSAYRYTRETSIYLHPNATGQGHGQQLYAQLLDLLRAQTVHLLLAGITLPNPASIKLHESLGFVQAGVMKEVGYKFNEYLDVGYWQLKL